MTKTARKREKLPENVKKWKLGERSGEEAGKEAGKEAGRSGQRSGERSGEKRGEGKRGEKTAEKGQKKGKKQFVLKTRENVQKVPGKTKRPKNDIKNHNHVFLRQKLPTAQKNQDAQYVAQTEPKTQEMTSKSAPSDDNAPKNNDQIRKVVQTIVDQG